MSHLLPEQQLQLRHLAAAAVLHAASAAYVIQDCALSLPHCLLLLLLHAARLAGDSALPDTSQPTHTMLLGLATSTLPCTAQDRWKEKHAAQLLGHVHLGCLMPQRCLVPLQQLFLGAPGWHHLLLLLVIVTELDLVLPLLL
jgi:hypothetical protein